MTADGNLISRLPMPTSQTTAMTSTSGRTHEVPLTAADSALEPASTAAAPSRVGSTYTPLSGGPTSVRPGTGGRAGSRRGSVRGRSTGAAGGRSAS